MTSTVHAVFPSKFAVLQIPKVTVDGKHKTSSPGVKFVSTDCLSPAFSVLK